MLKGGYQIIDLEGKDLRSGISMQYDNLYEKIEGTNKRIVLSGLAVDGVEYNDIEANFTVDGSDYVAEVYGYEVRISDINIVTVEKHGDALEIPFDSAVLGAAEAQVDIPGILGKVKEALNEGRNVAIKFVGDSPYLAYGDISINTLIATAFTVGETAITIYAPREPESPSIYFRITENKIECPVTW